MRQARRDLNLPTETLSAKRGAKILVEDLDCYATAVTNVCGKKDGSHSAFAQFSLDIICATEAFPQLLEKLLLQLPYFLCENEQRIQ